MRIVIESAARKSVFAEDRRKGEFCFPKAK